MGTTFVASIATAITLCAAGVAVAQPQPDPAPVPSPQPPTPAPVPSVTPPPATAPPPTRRQRQTREKKRPPAATARKVRSADRVYSTPIHLTRAEAGTVLADSTSAPGSEAASAPAVPATLVRATGSRSPSAAEAALLLLLGGTVLALVFAAVPARTLATVSPRLVERRADIGLAMAAVAVAVSAGILVVLVGT